MNKDIYDFIYSLIGTPYIWWKDGQSTFDSPAPFWINSDTIDSLFIKINGCNCAGFINLICRKNNIQIPGVLEKEYYAGGTYAWFNYLNYNNKLEQFNIYEQYEPGTLLLRGYTSPEDQGHMAIILEGNKLAHSYPEKGIQIDDSFHDSHNWITGGYYTHVCKPENWLIQNSL